MNRDPHDYTGLAKDVAGQLGRIAALANASYHEKNALQRVPRTIRDALVFRVLMEAFGFTPSAISFEELPVRELGISGNDSLLIARVTVQPLARFFCYPLGSMVHISRELSDAQRSFECESDDVRETLYRTSAMLLPRFVATLMQLMTRASVTPRATLGEMIPKLRGLGMPEECIQIVVAEIDAN
jgi:hypothetical protein